MKESRFKALKQFLGDKYAKNNKVFQYDQEIKDKFLNVIEDSKYKELILRYVNFSENGVSADFYPEAIPKLVREKDTYTVTMSYDSMRGPQGIYRNLDLDTAVEKLVFALERNIVNVASNNRKKIATEEKKQIDYEWNVPAHPKTKEKDGKMLTLLFRIQEYHSDDRWVGEEMLVWYTKDLDGRDESVYYLERSVFNGGNMWGNRYLGIDEISREQLCSLAERYPHVEAFLTEYMGKYNNQEEALYNVVYSSGCKVIPGQGGVEVEWKYVCLDLDTQKYMEVVEYASYGYRSPDFDTIEKHIQQYTPKERKNPFEKNMDVMVPKNVIITKELARQGVQPIIPDGVYRKKK